MSQSFFFRLQVFDCGPPTFVPVSEQRANVSLIKQKKSRGLKEVTTIHHS